MFLSFSLPYTLKWIKIFKNAYNCITYKSNLNTYGNMRGDWFQSVIGRILTPKHPPPKKDVCFLICSTCEYITLHVKGTLHLADMIKPREAIPILEALTWLQWVFQEGQSQRKSIRCCPTECEQGGSGHRSRDAGRLWEYVKSHRNKFSLKTVRRSTALPPWC